MRGKRLDIISGILFCLGLVGVVVMTGALDSDMIDFKKAVILGLVAIGLMFVSLKIANREDA